MKKVAILQSNYIPWRGYFDIINDADLFVFYDDVQFTKNDWRNRNQIKTCAGIKWLSVPVGRSIDRKIFEVTINESKWQQKHFETLRQNYSKTPFYREYESFLRSIYLEMQWQNLSELNQYMTKVISKDFLGIDTEFDDSRCYSSEGAKQERLLSIIKETGASVYISGPAAGDYINGQDFYDAGIILEWKDYSGYPEYPQQHGEFLGNVSILDLLFNTGHSAPYYIWGWREQNIES
jgi:hypothetical protein